VVQTGPFGFGRSALTIALTIITSLSIAGCQSVTKSESIAGESDLAGYKVFESRFGTHNDRVDTAFYFKPYDHAGVLAFCAFAVMADPEEVHIYRKFLNTNRLTVDGEHVLDLSFVKVFPSIEGARSDCVDTDIPYESSWLTADYDKTNTPVRVIY